MHRRRPLPLTVADIAENRNRLHGRDIFVNDSNDPFAALDRSIADTARGAKLEARIYRRVRALMKENGLNQAYCEEKALEQATLEITGAVS